MVERRSIGVGLISVGWMGRLHSRSYANLRYAYPEAEFTPRLVIAADAVQANVDYAVDVLGYSKGTLDYREVLADPEVDVVSICAPNFLHRIRRDDQPWRELRFGIRVPEVGIRP